VRTFIDNHPLYEDLVDLKHPASRTWVTDEIPRLRVFDPRCG